MPSRVQRLLLLHGGGPTALWVLTAHACALQRPLPPVPPDEPPFNTLYPEVGDPMTVSHCVAVPIGAVLEVQLLHSAPRALWGLKAVHRSARMTLLRAQVVLRGLSLMVPNLRDARTWLSGAGARPHAHARTRARTGLITKLKRGCQSEAT